MYSMRYMHRYDKDTTACTSKKQNYDGGTPADFFDCFSLIATRTVLIKFNLIDPIWDPGIPGDRTSRLRS